MRDRPPNLDWLDSSFALQLRDHFVVYRRSEQAQVRRDEKELSAAVIQCNDAVEKMIVDPVDFRAG